MTNEDRLKEVCETAQMVAHEEKEIVAIEKQIADRMREISAKIFGGAVKFRMRKIYIDDTPFWANIGIMIQDNIRWEGYFFGTAKMLRIDTAGKIWLTTQYVPRCRQYDLSDGKWSSGDYDQGNVVASDHFIAVHAAELAKELLEALRVRIDNMKEEKETLRRMAQAISSPAQKEE